MNKFFSVHRKKPYATWQATFCYSGQVYSFPTGELDLQRAQMKSLAEQPRILGLIKARIENEKKAAASDINACIKANRVPPAPRQPNLPNFKMPPPKGSLREKILEERSRIVNSVRSKSRMREAIQAEGLLYEALGVDVDLPVSKMDQTAGARVAALFSDSDHFRLSGANYARNMRRFLFPIVALGELNPEFMAPLEQVSKRVRFSK